MPTISGINKRRYDAIGQLKTLAGITSGRM